MVSPLVREVVERARALLEAIEERLLSADSEHIKAECDALQVALAPAPEPAGAFTEDIAWMKGVLEGQDYRLNDFDERIHALERDSHSPKDMTNALDRVEARLSALEATAIRYDPSKARKAHPDKMPLDIGSSSAPPPALERAAKEPAGKCLFCDGRGHSLGKLDLCKWCGGSGKEKPPPSTPQAETGRDDEYESPDFMTEWRGNCHMVEGNVSGNMMSRWEFQRAARSIARAAREAALEEAMAVKISPRDIPVTQSAEFWNGVHAYARAIDGLRAERERGATA